MERELGGEHRILFALHASPPSPLDDADHDLAAVVDAGDGAWALSKQVLLVLRH
jgi:hypothetical protein